MTTSPARPLALVAIAALGAASACRDVSRFSTEGGRYQGTVVQGSFVRAGVPAEVGMCLTLDTNHLQDAPGSLTTSDGLFRDAPLRPIPQIWHDPLSTLSFGEGRVRNLVYVATAGGDAGAGDVIVVVSLMQSGDVEVRLVRGAPQPDAGPPPAGQPPALYAVFDLKKEMGPCAL